MSNFVSCDRNIENLNLLADLVLAQGFGPSLGAAAAFGMFRFGKGRLEKFPISSTLIPATYSCPRTQGAAPRLCSSCGAVNGITEITQVKNNTRGEGSSGFLSHC